MLFFDWVYVDQPDGTVRFRWVKAPTSQELTQRVHTIANRVGRFLESQGLLERDAENSYLASEAVDDDPMNSLLGHSITYRIAVGPQAGRKVFTLQTLPACDPEDPFDDTIEPAQEVRLPALDTRLCRWSDAALSAERTASCSPAMAAIEPCGTRFEKRKKILNRIRSLSPGRCC